MSHLTQDLRYAARTLARQPGLALAAVLTLALGIGGNTAIFSIVDSALLTPPPFADPERVMVVWASNPQLAQMIGLEDKLPVSTGDFYDWQRETRSFEAMALLQPDRVTLTGRGEPELLAVVRATGDFFKVLGTPAARGRTFTLAEDAPGKPTVVVLSHNGWQRRFGGDPRVIGQKVLINGDPLTVIGVMPPRFAFPRGAEVPSAFAFAVEPDAWLPLALPEEMRADRRNRFSLVVGRLKPGVGAAAATEELKAVCDRIAKSFPGAQGWSAYMTPVAEQMIGDIRPALLVLWGAVGFVLLIACVNVANLLLARAASRQREIAVRTAIGAGRRRLIGQLLMESGLISVLGGVLGVALAVAGLRLFSAVVPPAVAAAASFEISGRALSFTALLCIATTVLAGLVPAFQMTRPDLAESLREGTRAGAGTAGGRLTRKVLVVVEVGLAVLLLIGAGLLLRSFVRLLGVDPGFRPGGVLSFEINLPQDRYPPPRRVVFFDRAVERLRATPGVVAAGSVSELPLTGVEAITGVLAEGAPPPESPDQVPLADWHKITPGYFETMGIPLLRGRMITAADAQGAPVAMIDEGMAKTLWPGQDPIGKRFRVASRMPDNPWVTVVGIVGTVRHSSLYADTRPQMYWLQAHTPPDQIPYQAVIVLRTAGDPDSFADEARAAVHEVDPDQPLTSVRSMQRVVSDSVAQRRLLLLLLGLLALLALTLAVVGIYGVTSYSVSQRTREMGLRMALGARPQGVVRMVMGEAGTLAVIGVVLGVVAAFAATRLLAARLGEVLYQVRATDPLTFVTVALGLTLVALVAAWVPGRRATRVDPVIALRGE